MDKEEDLKKPEQLEFKVIMDTSKNWFACPKINGIDNEFEYNQQQIKKVSNASIWGSISLYERQVYLIKERTKC
jgi:hypothetical protein